MELLLLKVRCYIFDWFTEKKREAFEVNLYKSISWVQSITNEVVLARLQSPPNLLLTTKERKTFDLKWELKNRSCSNLYLKAKSKQDHLEETKLYMKNWVSLIVRWITNVRLEIMYYKEGDDTKEDRSTLRSSEGPTSLTNNNNYKIRAAALTHFPESSGKFAVYLA